MSYVIWFMLHVANITLRSLSDWTTVKSLKQPMLLNPIFDILISFLPLITPAGRQSTIQKLKIKFYQNIQVVVCQVANTY